MKPSIVIILGALPLAVRATPRADVDESYPYTGPDIPVGDWVDSSVNGNGKGFPRLVEPPAVRPAVANPTNNVNVIALSYIPGGINVHFQTPFGLGGVPTVQWGTTPADLYSQATGSTRTYDRTPPCSLVTAITQCSQHFHDVQISGLKPGTTYYYQIPASNGTTASDVLSFVTARGAGVDGEFSVAVLVDMGYTNAGGTYKQILKTINDGGTAFVWHGGDLSYADDWYSGILPCADDWPVCYNGTSTDLPGGFPTPPEYDVPVPEGEIADQGGPQGGDMSVLYESNWDLWQQWMNNITTRIPYMVLPGNHEPSCGEFDGPGNILTAYLDNDTANGTAAETALTYYSCPPSQRNFTAYEHRFRMPGAETGGVGNMWYSFDYGLAHFISLDAETDFAHSPENPFAQDLKTGETKPTEDETFITDSGPFGAVGDYNDTKTYAQYQWLEKDLAGIDRSKTPWVIAMAHRPMFSSQVSSYQADLRDAFQALLLEHEVDVYLSGHIHWYERLWPMTSTGGIDTASIINNNTYTTNPGVSMTHVINGMAGNVESHSLLDSGTSTLNITAVLDFQHYGFNKLTVINSTALSMIFVKGEDGSVGDEVTLVKRPSGPAPSTAINPVPNSTCSSGSVGTATPGGSTSASAVYTSTPIAIITPIGISTETVSSCSNSPTGSLPNATTTTGIATSSPSPITSAATNSSARLVVSLVASLLASIGVLL